MTKSWFKGRFTKEFLFLIFRMGLTQKKCDEDKLRTAIEIFKFKGFNFRESSQDNLASQRPHSAEK